MCYQQLDNQQEKMVQIRGRNLGREVRICWKTVGTQHSCFFFFFFQLLGWSSSWLQATMQEWTGKCSNVTQMSQQSVNPWFWQQFSGIQEMTVVRCWCFLLLCFASRMRENKTWKVNTDDGKLRGCSWSLFFPPDVWSRVCWRKCEEQMFALSSVCLWRM